jgi:hypothetical protein
MKQSFREASESYERWLGNWVELDRIALAAKQKKMAESDFAFLRATFYRWISRWLEAAENNTDKNSVFAAPTVLSIGDIHLENFGIWRDRDGRLAWGVNDFDEACELPYTQDLLRLAVSVQLASQDEPELHLSREEALTAILSGYRAAMLAGLDKANPIVLAEENDWLRTIALEQIKDAGKFWKKEQDIKKSVPLTPEEVPEDVYSTLRVLWPDPLPDAVSHPAQNLRWYRRQAGLGSLGRPRYGLFGLWRGGIIAREAKALVPSAYYWASKKQPIRPHIGQVLTKSVRSPDPLQGIVDQWLVRRIAPDCIKLEITELETLSKAKMLEAMGREIANVHLGCASPAIAEAIRRDLLQREAHTPNWLSTNADKLAVNVRKDRKSI